VKKGKGEKVVNDEPDNSSLFGCMKDDLKINGDIFSTGCWPSDEEMIQKYSEMVVDLEAEAEALEWCEGTTDDH